MSNHLPPQRPHLAPSAAGYESGAAAAGARTERVAEVNGIRIAYDTVGDPADPALLLIMGLGMQLVHWEDQLCALLAARGFFVVRFDNRDVGRSGRTGDGRRPGLLAANTLTAGRSSG